ncbi:MAG: hypothetical protein GF308_06850 [Candidatus Heimdallarchaeota archaeon]|nr:hypothetical protein [Candidatus Heimdallarchaeota archaeon]
MRKKESKMSKETNIKHSSFWRVPAHITGLFQIVENEDTLRKGSRGAGFSINNFILTRISFKNDSNSQRVNVFYNNQEIDGQVSKKVASIFQKSNRRRGLDIFHYSKLPIKGGFGTSGAGALGTAFALNEIYTSKLSKEKLGQIAHKAEVICGTGLGDVIAQSRGGAEIRLEPGAPGIGVIKAFSWPKKYKILSVFLGTLSTKVVITSPDYKQLINNVSEKLLGKLKDEPSLENFVEASYEFARNVNLMKGEVKRLIKELRENDYLASMIMIGKSIFVVGSANDLTDCYQFIQNECPKAKLWVNELARTGPIKTRKIPEHINQL